MPRKVKFGKKLERKEKIACGYVRVSSTQQKEEGHSLEQQERAIKSYCKAKGYRLNPERIYRDEGRSGFKDVKRPGLRALMDDVQDERVDICVVFSISRFYRRTLDLLKDIETMKEHNVAFISLNESFDTSTPIGKAVLSILGSIAEMESAQKSVYTTVGKTAKAKKIGWAGARRPHGWDYVKGTNGNGRVEVIEPIYKKKPKGHPERNKIETILSMYNNGEGMYKIHKKTGASLPSILTVLSNPVHAGMLVWAPGENAIVKKGKFEGYITVSQYNANQRKRNSRNTNTRKQNPLYTIHRRGKQFYLRELI